MPVMLERQPWARLSMPSAALENELSSVEKTPEPGAADSTLRSAVSLRLASSKVRSCSSSWLRICW
ncbi:hypothetical protein D3C87_1647770 [compost metagenome]